MWPCGYRSYVIPQPVEVRARLSHSLHAVFYAPAAFAHECKYPVQKSTREKFGFFWFVFLSWLNVSEVETAKIPSGKARCLWQLCRDCHSGQQPWSSPSFTPPKCAQKNSYSAIRTLLTFSLTFPFLSQLLAEILNVISLLIPLSPSAVHSNAMAVPSEAPDIMYRWQCGPQQDDHSSEGAHVAWETPQQYVLFLWPPDLTLGRDLPSDQTRSTLEATPRPTKWRSVTSGGSPGPVRRTQPSVDSYHHQPGCCWSLSVAHIPVFWELWYSG